MVNHDEVREALGAATRDELVMLSGILIGLLTLNSRSAAALHESAMRLRNREPEDRDLVAQTSSQLLYHRASRLAGLLVEEELERLERSPCAG